MGIFALLSSIIYGEKRRPLRQKLTNQQTKLISHTSDALGNAQSVITFASQKNEYNKHNILSNNLLKTRLHNWKTVANFGNLRLIILFILQFILLLVLIKEIQQNTNLIGIGIFTFIFAATFFFTRFFELDTVIRAVEDALSNAEPMTKMILEQNKIKDIKNAKNLIVTNGEINLNNVSFYYQDNKNNEHVFNNLNLQILPKQMQIRQAMETSIW